MAYATVADLVARYTEPTIAGLTDLTRLGSVNAEIAQQGLDDASDRNRRLSGIAL